jgi:hypothetical protein
MDAEILNLPHRGHTPLADAEYALDTSTADGVAVHGARDRDGPRAVGRKSAFVADSASVGLDGMPA